MVDVHHMAHGIMTQFHPSVGVVCVGVPPCSRPQLEGGTVFCCCVHDALQHTIIASFELWCVAGHMVSVPCHEHH